MIEGSVDLLAFNLASGWASELPENKTKLTIKAMLHNREIARCVACMPRKDLGFLGDGGRFAFTLEYEPVEELDALKIIAETANCARLLPVLQKKAITRGYQTFADQKGDSDSFAKLERLGLPERMDGMSVLDIGCNEGFFCQDAQARGAAKVTGIDANRNFIEKARARDPNTTYICANWWNLPDEQYDFIYFFSALHYENRPAQFFDMLAAHLKPRGQLILECGVYTECDNQTMVEAPRGDGVFRYPSRPYLTRTLLKRYMPRFHGKSVPQAGDPIERFVYHASLRQLVAIFLTGPSLSGKTSLASLLANNDKAVNFSIDLWLWQQKEASVPKPAENPIYAAIHKDYSSGDIRGFIDSLDDRMAAFLADALFNSLPLDCECLILEGYALQRKAISEKLASKFHSQGIRLWKMERLFQGMDETEKKTAFL